jgi:hypothetical protein
VQTSRRAINGTHADEEHSEQPAAGMEAAAASPPVRARGTHAGARRSPHVTSRSQLSAFPFDSLAVERASRRRMFRRSDPIRSDPSFLSRSCCSVRADKQTKRIAAAAISRLCRESERRIRVGSTCAFPAAWPPARRRLAVV